MPLDRFTSKTLCTRKSESHSRWLSNIPPPSLARSLARSILFDLRKRSRSYSRSEETRSSPRSIEPFFALPNIFRDFIIIINNPHARESLGESLRQFSLERCFIAAINIAISVAYAPRNERRAGPTFRRHDPIESGNSKLNHP